MSLLTLPFSPHYSGKVMHSMTAHMDAVTGLAVDPHGLYLLSGSESALGKGEGKGRIVFVLLGGCSRAMDQCCPSKREGAEP